MNIRPILTKVRRIVRRRLPLAVVLAPYTVKKNGR